MIRSYRPFILFALIGLLAPAPVQALGLLSVKVVNGYNLIVDSNVTAPPTYAPRSAYIGAEICNTGDATLNNVFANVGNYNGGVSPTPGIFPVKSFGAGGSTPLLAGTGNYSLSLASSLAEGSRYVGTLLAGECRIQYWLFTYPACINISDGAGGFVSQEPPCTASITGGIKPDDDLSLNYDVWATTSTPAVATVAKRRSFVMRNEISAAANKIWPNTTAKVPSEYLSAIQSVLGWGTLGPDGQPLSDTSPIYPGQRVITTQGIWYDLGNVGAGFDNDGDLIPDKNAWLQPVGDYTTFNANCFRMVRVYGIVVVKLVTGGELLIPFQDQLYFEHLPENTGVVGLVYYQYVATDQGCSANLSPYQEAASGFDNEKFSGDYGLNLGLKSASFGANLAFSKTDGVASTSSGSTLTYAGTATNNVGVNLGAPDLGVSLTFIETIPAGTTFVAGTAADTGGTNLTEPTGTGSYMQGYTNTLGALVTCPLNYNITSSAFVVLYSNDNGATFSLTEPGGVTNIKWLLITTIALDGGFVGTGTSCLPNDGIYDNGTIQTSLPPGKSTTFRFQVLVGAATGPVICNTAYVGFGSAQSNKSAQDCDIVSGINSLSGTVFKDDGAGGGTYGNGVKDNASEVGIGAGVQVKLYYDVNGNGKYDNTDLLYGSTTSSASGTYSFTNLPDGPFVVVLKKYDGTSRNLSGTTGLDSTIVTSAGLFRFTDVGSAISGTGIPGGSTIVSFTSASSVTISNPATVGATNTLSVAPNTATNDAVDDSTFGFTGYGNTTKDPKLPLTTAQGILSLDENLIYATLAVNIDLPRTNPAAQAVTLVDFGFAPPLLVTKTVPVSLVDEGDFFTYTINLKNRLPSVGVQGPTGCEYTVWASSGTNGSPANKEFTDYLNALDGPNRSVATVLMSGGSNNFMRGTGFNLAQQAGAITKVENLVMAYFSTTPTNDSLTLVSILGASTDSGALSTGVIANYVGEPATLDPNSAMSRDITSLRPGGGSWTYADFSTLTFEVNPTKAASADQRIFSVDAIGLRVTTNAACQAGASTTLNPVPLQDRFDTGSFTFVSAVPPPTTVSGGTLQWANVGPILPGATTSVFVTVRAKDIAGLRTGTCAVLPGTGAPMANNSACNYAEGGYVGSDVYYSDGRKANNAAASVPVNIQGKAGLKGIIWKDVSDTGWAFNGTDPTLANVAVTLYACTQTTGALETGTSNTKSCDGSGGSAITGGNTWAKLATTTTNSSGAYEFIGLDSGYYIVEVGDTDGLASGGNTSPYSGVESGEANDAQDPTGGGAAGGHDCTGHGAGPFAACNNIWGTSTASLRSDQTTINFLNGATEENITGINFGYYITTASLYGNIWHDVNGNATREGQDGNLAGFTVARWSDPNGDGNPADGVLQASTTSDAQGNWSFTGLAAASYVIVVTPPTLLNNVWKETVESTGGTGSLNNQIPVTLTAGQVSGSHDFGYTLSSTSSIGDTVYYDFDGNGVQSAGETGISGVTVLLYKDVDRDGTIDAGVDNVVATTTTSATGAYLFTGLAAGSYIVKVDTSTLPSNVTPSADPDINAGTIGDRLYYDANRNGVDNSEDGIPGVVVRLWVASRTVSATTVSGAANVSSAALFQAADVGRAISGTGIPPGATIVGFVNASNVTISAPATSSATSTLTLGDIVASTATNVNGNYLFTGLNAGSYFVSVDPATLPSSALTLTTPAAGATVATLTTNGASSSILTKDAGYGGGANYAIGNRVWHDVNNDGLQNAGEVGFSGVRVTITQSTAPAGLCYTTSPCVAVTNKAGFWIQTGLTTGRTYTVTPTVADLPPNYILTTGSASLSPTIAGADIMSLDFGYRYNPSAGTSPTGTITGSIFVDTNSNRAAESRTLSGTTTLASTTVTSAALFLATDVGKSISGTGIPQGATIVAFNSTSSVTISVPATSAATSTLTVGEGLNGSIVNLLDGANNIIATTTTTNGVYSFNGVLVGNYSVQSVAALGTFYSTVFVSAAQTFPNLNVIYDRTTETTANSQSAVAVDGVYNDLMQDFGYKRFSSSIGDTVYLDANENATQDFGEPGFSGVTVRLYIWKDAVVDGGNGNGVVDSGELTLSATQVTTADNPLTAQDESGKYLFSNVATLPASQSYVVEVDTSTLPGLLGSTLTLIADPNSDGVPCPSLSSPANLVCDNRDLIVAPTSGGAGFVAGTNYLGADFGYQLSGVTGYAHVGDHVWIDSNGNGIKDIGEPGIPRITVFLDANNNGALNWTDTNGNGRWDSGEGEQWVETDTDGYYLFTGLADTAGVHLRVLTSDVDWPATLPTTPTFEARLTNGASRNNDVTVVISGGNVTSINDGVTSSCGGFPDGTAPCALSADFGYRYTGNNTLSGTVCIDDAAPNGVCATGTTANGVTAGSESALAGIQVFLYNWVDTNGNLRAWDTRGLSGTTVSGSTTVTSAGLFNSTDVGAAISGPGIPANATIVAVNSTSSVTISAPATANATNTLTVASGALDPTDVLTLLGSTSTNATGDYSFSNVPNNVVVVLGVSDTQSLRLTTTNANVVDVGAGGDTVASRGVYDGITTYQGNVVTVVTKRALSFTDGVDVDLTVAAQNVDFAFDSTLGGTIIKDFGDLPDLLGTQTNSPSEYNATFLSSGASHRIRPTYSVTTTIGLTNVTSPSSSFRASDVGSPIVGAGIPVGATITAVAGPGSATISAAATGSATVTASLGFFLGSGVSAEPDGLASPTAAGDTLDDGITLVGNTMDVNYGGTIRATASGASWLVGWIDFNQDGDFADEGERILNQAVSAGTQDIPFTVALPGPGDVSPAGSYTFFSRFRLYPSQPSLLAPTGAALDASFQQVQGEVEDYAFIAAVTRVTVTSFLARDMGGFLAVQWETSSEVGTVGFFLNRWDDNEGRFVQVNDKLLPSVRRAQGGKYSYIDSGASVGATHGYQLVEVEASGRRIVMGPYSVDTGVTMAHDLASGRPDVLEPDHGPTGYVSVPHKGRRLGTPSGKEAARVSSTAGDPFGRRAPSQGAKIGVRETGVHYVSAQDLSDKAGLSVDKTWLSSNKNLYSMTVAGESVPFAASADGQGFLFYGQKPASRFSRDNVYWIGPSTRNAPRMMTRKDWPKQAPRGDESFTRVLHAEQQVVAAPETFQAADGDHWFWDYVYSGWSTSNLTFRADGALRSGNASLTIRLRGGTQTGANPDHHAMIRLNGQDLGDVYWDGFDEVTPTFTVPSSVLIDGENTVQVEGLTDTEAPWSLFYVDFFDLQFQSLYRAHGNRFEGSTGGHGSILISGFTRSDIMVFDVTNPRLPVSVEGQVVQMAGGRYGVALSPTAANTAYSAVAGDARLAPTRIEGDTPSSLKSSANQGAYLIITTREMMQAAQGLADYRSDLRSKVVDIEDIYDEFNGGIGNPHALKAFLGYARANWVTPPRYVVLAGDGTYDYQHVRQSPDWPNPWGEDTTDDNLIPPMMVPTPNGLFPSDVWFADLDPSGAAPEIAIGRLPATTPTELAGLIEKIKAREASSGSPWLNHVLMASDRPDEAGDFLFSSQLIAGSLPPGSFVTPIDLSSLGHDQARSALFDGINQGAGSISYVGHGGYNVLSNDGLLWSSDTYYLSNTQWSPVMTAMTCLVGNFGLPGYPSLGEDLVTLQGGGLVALWAPTGMSENQFAVSLAQGYYAASAGPGTRIGDAILASMKAYKRAGGPNYMLAIYTLLGDPAMRLR